MINPETKHPESKNIATVNENIEAVESDTSPELKIVVE